MANLPELSQFDSVYQIETTDLVQGGADGVTNTPLKALTNRTKWLKDRVDMGLRTNGTLAYTYTVDKTLEVEHIGKHLKIQHTGGLGNTLTIPTAGVADGQLLSLEGVGTNLMTLAGVAGVSSFFPGMQIIIRFNGASWEIFQTNDVGKVISYARSVAPIGYLKCNGAAISRTTYARLFSIIGTTFGVGDGSTTFNLPDLRGEFIRGWDDGRGIDSGRAFGSAQQGTIHAIDSTGINQIYSAVMTSASLGSANAALVAQRTGLDYDASGATNYPNTTAAYANGDGSGGFDYGISRPRNVALLYCIKF
jgi:microcystin-dependent protein